MLLLQQPKFGGRTKLLKEVNKFHFYVHKNYPRIGRFSSEEYYNGVQQQGCAMEYFVYCLLETFNPDADLEFNLDKCASQWAFGRDGKADSGYDMKLNGHTIDVKADAALARGYVCLELQTKTGKPSLLLGDTEYSIHCRFTDKNLPSLTKFNKGAEIVFVDLKGLRGILDKADEGYKIGPYSSRIAQPQTTVIDLPISYLTQAGLADTYRF